MIKKILVILLVSVFFVHLVSAIDTEIRLKTPSFTEVDLTILDVDIAGFSALDGPHKLISDYYGDLSYVYSGSESNFDLMVYLKKGGKEIYSKKYREYYPAGEPIYLEIIPDGYELIETPDSVPLISNVTNSTNSTELNETTNSTLLNSSNSSAGVAGLSISKDSKIFSLKTLLYILGIAVLFFIGFFAFKFAQTQKTPKIKITKLSDMNPSKKEGKKDSHGEESNVNKIIGEAEEKLKLAQAEISGLKKQQRIKELKEKMARDKKELRDLSRG